MAKFITCQRGHEKARAFGLCPSFSRQGGNAFFAGGQKPIDHMQVDFNLWEATAEYVINANEVNITSFLGSARMSVTPVGNMLRLQLDNTTDQHSLDAHLPWIQGVPRSPGQLTPQGTTYQRFIWYVEIK